MHRNKTQMARATLALAGPVLLAGLGAAAFALNSGDGRPHGDSGAVAGAAAKRLALRVSPLTQRVAPGQSTSFALEINRRGRGKVKLRIVDPLPQGLAAALPRATRKRRARLAVSTVGVRSGGYRLRLQARRGRHRATAAANLVIHTPREAATGISGGSGGSGATGFSIGGDLPGELSPGAGQSLNLVLANPGSAEISVTSIGVDIERIEAPGADATHPCGSADFLVQQFSGAYGFRLGPASSASLADLGFASAKWPRVTMLDRPVNQDGCKRASLGLRYVGTSTGGAS